MNQITTICLIFVVTLLIGCASPVESYLKTHPETSAEIANSMRNSTVQSGMTKEQVEITAGPTWEKSAWEPLFGGTLVAGVMDPNEYYQAWIYKKYEYETKPKQFSSSGYDAFGNYSYRSGVEWSPQPTGSYTEIRILFEGDKVLKIQTKRFDVNERSADPGMKIIRINAGDPGAQELIDKLNRGERINP